MNDVQTVNTASVTKTEGGISLKGNILFSTVSSVLYEACTHLEHNIEISKTDLIVVDISAVEKIDSSGISLLLAFKRLCDSHHKIIHISGAQPQAISLITTNKLHKILL